MANKIIFKTLMLKGDAGEPTAEQTQAAVNEYMQEHPDAAIDETIINSSVADWLGDHPEATTTVLDGSLTESKFSNALKLETIKEYVTPEMFGAVGDGTTDDSTAFTSALASGKAVYCDFSKTYKADIQISTSNIFIMNMKLKGTITFESNLQFVTLFNCDIDATGKNYGIYTEVNVTKLRLYSVHVHDATVDNIHLYRCWDAMLISVSATGAGNNNFDLQQFNNGYLLGTSYFANNKGIYITNTKACTVIATIQECKKTGIDIDSVHGSTFRLYLEQNGYNGSDDYEKSQMIVGKTSRCVGDSITFYAIGGVGSDMESKHGIFLIYSDSCSYTGFAEEHLSDGFRCGSNARGNVYDVIDKTHANKTYDVVSCKMQCYGVTAESSNTLINIDATQEFEYIPVVKGSTAYMVSFEKRSSTQALIRVTDYTGTNQNADVNLFKLSTGIKTA